MICLSAHREDVIAAWGCVIGGVELPTPGSHVWLAPWNVLYIWVYVNRGQEIRKRLNSWLFPHDSSKTITPIEADKFVQVNMTLEAHLDWGCITPVYGPQVKELNRPQHRAPRLLKTPVRKILFSVNPVLCWAHKTRCVLDLKNIRKRRVLMQLGILGNVV